MAGKYGPLIMVEFFLLIISGFFLILGNYMHVDIWNILGIIFSVGVFFFSWFITVGAKGDTEVDDLTLVNMLIPPLIVGDIMTIGSYYDADPVVQSMWLDLGLITGLFIIFLYIWYLIREKIKGGWSFLEAESINIDFHSDKDADKLPQFFLVALILGFMYGLLFVLFKALYVAIGYNWTVYLFMGIEALVCIMLSFGIRLIDIIRSKALTSKATTKPATKEAPKAATKEAPKT